MDTESALIIPVPNAEPVVGAWRRELDPSARVGVPAHITVLYPFVQPDRIDAATLDDLAALFAGVARFDFRLNEVRWFGDRVVWLAPTPNEPFNALTNLVGDHWPDHPPYEGRHSVVIPHLTVGDGARLDLLEEAAEEVAAVLPIEAAGDEVWLMSGTWQPDSWRVREVFGLGVGAT